MAWVMLVPLLFRILKSPSKYLFMKLAVTYGTFQTCELLVCPKDAAKFEDVVASL